MPGIVESDRRSYRRGLLLGLTMAEVFILVVFGLLLAWMVGVTDSKGLEQRVEGLQARLAELEQQRDLLLGVTASQNRFDDVFRELTLARQELALQERRVAGLQERAQILEDAAREAGLAGAPSSELAAAIKRRLEIANALLSQTSASGLADDDAAAVEKQVAGLVEMRRRLMREGFKETDVATLAGRLRNAERRLQEATRGTEWPACWADATGKPEYIFDVVLSSRGLVIRNNAVPHRQGEQAALPGAGIAFDSALSPGAFRSQTMAIFEWSQRANCRFFVRIRDTTAAHEKDLYKARLRTVGEHFYYYEELGPSNGPAAATR